MSGDDVNFSTGTSIDEAPPLAGMSIADRIAADREKRNRRVVNVSHPDVPEWRVIYRLPIDSTEFDDLKDRADKARKRKVKYDFDAALLALFCVAVVYRGEQLEDAGEPLTFQDKQLRGILGDPIMTASEAVVALYGSDGIVSSIATALTKKAGYGTEDDVDVVDAPDPTVGG